VHARLEALERQHLSSSDSAKTMPKMTLDHDGSPGLLFLDTNDALLFKAP
jgi:hypothetical protein